MKDRLASIINDLLYKAISEVLDTTSCQQVEFEDLNVTTVINHFSSVLNNDNNFNRRKVKNKSELIYKHVCCFMSNTKPAYSWPTIFNLRLELGVSNALIIAEFALSPDFPMPTANKLSHFCRELLAKTDCQ